MSNQKLENLLNLALETPEILRQKSLNLNIGYQENARTWEIIVKYNGSLDELRKWNVVVEELIFGYAILTVPEERILDIAQFEAIEYVEKPKRMFFSSIEFMDAKEKTCVLPVSNREPFLTGKGTIIGIIDSGIDYSHPAFINEDGSSKILSIWDQTLEVDMKNGKKPPEGFLNGVEFSKEEITEAINIPELKKRYEKVPSVDYTGHGTAVAGIAAGNANEQKKYIGMAPESELIVVKLGRPNDSYPRTTQLMRGLTYVVKKAQSLKRPLAVNLSFGNTYGAHDGSSLLERFLDNISECGRTVVCVGTGNEADSNGHCHGRDFQVELAVSDFESILNVQLWKNYVDQYQLSLKSPRGERISVPIYKQGRSIFQLSQTIVLVYCGAPTPYSVAQEIYFEFLPVKTYITSGIWTFFLEPMKPVIDDVYFYLPSRGVRNYKTEFYKPVPEDTITIPATARRPVSVGAYNSVLDRYAEFSGRGYQIELQGRGSFTRLGCKPDLVAPGVRILAPNKSGDYEIVTGTSFAVPFVTGAAALLMEWGIVLENDPFLYGEKVKAYLQKGAKRIRGEEYYPNEKVGYGALCVYDSLPI